MRSRFYMMNPRIWWSISPSTKLNVPAPRSIEPTKVLKTREHHDAGPARQSNIIQSRSVSRCWHQTGRPKHTPTHPETVAGRTLLEHMMPLEELCSTIPSTNPPKLRPVGCQQISVDAPIAYLTFSPYITSLIGFTQRHPNFSVSVAFNSCCCSV